ncbi:MAG: InlB B-repeat-containing protein, partial [Tannerella sp.]|nr:InlB B-repeat-containing protein [Tannerella sp.]
VTFSAPARGGGILNATPQALDYRTAPRTGILVVPDEGYRFAGWSHDNYISLRGERIAARTGIMHYDTLTVYGSVELRAVFAPEEYPLRYHLHGGENAEGNPPAYTVESDVITLGAPHKANDVFTGWTGANGDDPQPSVVIPHGSTGERDYYANYLYSGREAVEVPASTSASEDKIWAFEGELYVRTSKPGAIIRIYSPDGILYRLQTVVTAGETRIKLPPGIYIVTLNNGAGRKVMIE